jgi:hypothetical protein
MEAETFKITHSAVFMLNELTDEKEEMFEYQ